MFTRVRADRRPTAPASAKSSGRRLFRRRKGEPVAPRRRTPGQVRPGRYTPPIPRRLKQSPRWVGVVILTLLVLGVGLLIINYFGILPGGVNTWYLAGGLVLIALSLVIATTYR